MKSCYLVGYTALINFDLLQLSGLLSSEETRQRALVIPKIPPSTTVANRVSNTQNKPPQNGRPTQQPPQTPNTIIQNNIPTCKGITLEMHIQNDAGRQVFSGVPIQPPQRPPKAKVSPRRGMPGIGQEWLHLPEGCHGIVKISGSVQHQIPQYDRPS